MQPETKLNNRLLKGISYLWQAPQNLLGLGVIFFSRAKPGEGIKPYWATKANFGVSLGKYIISNSGDKTTLLHEAGHQKQSLMLGPLYLLIVGLPSISGNIWDRLFHKSWSWEKREIWYYSLPWEKWADKLGGVERFIKPDSTILLEK